jgi:exocyst complex component 4
MLISNTRLLRLPNEYSIKKMMRIMLALQQSIKTLTNDEQNTEFERAKQYYSLYYLTPQVRFLAPQVVRDTFGSYYLHIGYVG